MPSKKELDLMLRPYRGEDEDEAIALWLATWKLAYPSIDFDARVDWWRTRWRSELVPACEIVMAEEDGALVGFVTMDSNGYLDQLVVSPTHWGSDVAGLLMADAKRLSPGGITLKVNADNVRAIRFYVRHGFIDDGEDVNPASKRTVMKMRWMGV